MFGMDIIPKSPAKRVAGFKSRLRRQLSTAKVEPVPQEHPPAQLTTTTPLRSTYTSPPSSNQRNAPNHDSPTHRTPKRAPISTATPPTTPLPALDTPDGKLPPLPDIEACKPTSLRFESSASILFTAAVGATLLEDTGSSAADEQKQHQADEEQEQEAQENTVATEVRAMYSTVYERLLFSFFPLFPRKLLLSPFRSFVGGRSHPTARCPGLYTDVDRCTFCCIHTMGMRCPPDMCTIDINPAGGCVYPPLLAAHEHVYKLLRCD